MGVFPQMTWAYGLRGTNTAQELRRGTQRAALLDSLYFLSDESPWKHTVVAWTGEIQRRPVHDHETRSEDKSDTALLPASLSTGSVPPKARFNEVFLTRHDQLQLEEQLYKDRLQTVPVWLAGENEVSDMGVKLRDQTRWRRYAEHDLCALLHYQQHPPDDGYKETARWADYVRMNQLFADKVSEVYNAGDVVLVHDYYLVLLPDLLRQRHPDMRIVFFTHTPFPSSELVRCLTRRKIILQGVLGSDLVAFQSFHYAQHFANSCSRILGLRAGSHSVSTPSRRVQLEVLPAGINVSDIHSLAWSVPVTEKCISLRKMYAGRKILVACDATDRLGGVDKKLLAFDRFLEMFPDWRHKVVLLQAFGPHVASEDEDGEDARYVRTVNALVHSINCKYGSLDYMPIQLHAQSLSTDDYFALMRSGDVALFTSIRDGMSTTSLEYVVCQQNTHGCTIISEFSGTASNLEEAIHINPWDTVDVAKQIHKALNMTAESRQDMFMALYRRLAEKDVKYWITSALRGLLSAVQRRQPAKSPGPAASVAVMREQKRNLLLQA